MPHTPHTPGAAISHPLTPSNGPPSVSSIYNETTNNLNANHASPAQNHSPQHKSNMSVTQNAVDTMPVNRPSDGLVNLSAVDLNGDLNFDPTSIIDSDANGDLNVSVCARINLFRFAFAL